MRLKPVTERSPQHASRCPERSALHDVVPSVEKSGGVARIEWKSLEPVERREGRAGPLPAVADEVGDASIAARTRSQYRRICCGEGQSEGTSAGRCPSIGSIPKAKSFSKSGSSDAPSKMVDV